jgi:hypothetical protein
MAITFPEAVSTVEELINSPITCNLPPSVYGHYISRGGAYRDSHEAPTILYRTWGVDGQGSRFDVVHTQEIPEEFKQDMG